MVEPPIWKICASQIGSSPQFSGWKFQKCLSCHHLAMLWSPLPIFFLGSHFMTFFKTPHFHRTTGTIRLRHNSSACLGRFPRAQLCTAAPKVTTSGSTLCLGEEVRGGKSREAPVTYPKAKLRFRSPRTKGFFCTFSELNKKTNPANWKIGYIKGISGTMHQRFAK